MRTILKIAFVAVLAAMLWVTWQASLDRDVLTAGKEIWADPWGKATLFDTYFAFLTIWLFVAWRERGWISRLLWLLAILVLGNFAIAVYFLIALFQLRPGEDWGRIFAQKPR